MTLSGPAIRVERLTKRYGEHAAVADISFEVARGEVVGFLGPNGAGKSTTLKILCGFLGATSGRCFVEGFDVAEEHDEARAAIGYMPEATPLYGEMRVREYLTFRAELKGVPRKVRKANVEEAMARAKVSDVADTLIEVLSKGYKQRVGLADALVSRPPLLVLDEPTAGMDPNQIREVRELVRSLGRAGGGEQTVLLSTHILSEVEATCSRVMVIDRGSLVAQGTPEELGRLRRPPRLRVVVRGEESAARAALVKLDRPGLAIAEVTRVGEGELALSIDLGTDTEPAHTTESIVELLVLGKLRVREVAPGKTSLEDVFASLTTDAHDELASPEGAPS
ncbi:MAG: ABC transporter ATP-binding protein [Polyangiales bacterium]